MAHKEPVHIDQDAIRLSDLTSRMAGLGLGLAILGLGATWYLSRGHDEILRPMFFHSYLVVFCFFLSITLGALFFTILHHLARAGWSTVLRRLAEGIAGNVYLMLILFIPLLFGLQDLYSWARPGVTASDPILAGKAAWLSVNGFYIRFAIYFVVWFFLASFFRRNSIRQDSSGDLKLSRKMELASMPGMILFAFSLTFAFFDLLMSLNPRWFSTIFGVYCFAGSVLSFLVVLTLLSLWLQRAGRLRNVITTEHFHDTGKLTFAFTFFWGYIAFSQYMLIWYANMPEETQFFIPRQLGPWKVLSFILLFCHLLLPFAGMLSRHAKRRLAVFTFWGLWLLLAHALDMFWLVMPHYFADKMQTLIVKPGDHMTFNEVAQRMVASNQNIYSLRPEYAWFENVVNTPLTSGPLLLTLSLFVGVGGLYLVSTALMLRGPALIPVNDPRLPESLAFENV